MKNIFNKILVLIVIIGCSYLSSSAQKLTLKDSSGNTEKVKMVKKTRILFG